MKNLIPFMCLSVLSLFSFAEEVKTSGNKEYNIVDQPEAIYKNSSEHMRIDKKYQVNGYLFGIGPNIASTTGVEAGLFLDKDSLLLAQITQGNSRYNYSSSYGSDYKFDTTSVGVHYKKFVSNSFYVKLGGDYRTADYSYKYRSSLGSNYDTDRSFKGTSTAITFQIGNQWQWENFTIGCDWVGYTMPVLSNISSENVTSPSDYAYDLKRNQEEQDTLVKNGHLNLLRFYLGLSF